MTITEVANELEVSHWTVRRWIRERKFPVTKINSRVIRIKRDDLDKFISKNTVKAFSM